MTRSRRSHFVKMGCTTSERLYGTNGVLHATEGQNAVLQRGQFRADETQRGVLEPGWAAARLLSD